MQNDRFDILGLQRDNRGECVALRAISTNGDHEMGVNVSKAREARKRVRGRLGWTLGPRKATCPVFSDERVTELGRRGRDRERMTKQGRWSVILKNRELGRRSGRTWCR